MIVMSANKENDRFSNQKLENKHFKLKYVHIFNDIKKKKINTISTTDAAKFIETKHFRLSHAGTTYDIEIIAFHCS